MLTRSIVATAVTVLALSPVAAQQALAVGAGDLPGDLPTPSAAPSALEPMEGMTHDEMPGAGHEDMPGMTRDEMPGAGHEDMPGMNHGSGVGARSDATAGSAEQGSSHSHAEAPSSAGPRPTGLLVGAFAAVNAGVMGAALVVRRRERATRGPHLTPSTHQPVRGTQED